MGISNRFSAWLDRLGLGSSQIAPIDDCRRTADLRRRWFQPQVELLEDRSLLSAGGLDPTFALGGTTVPDPDATAKGIVVEGDGKIVVLDQTQTGYGILRFDTNGSPDTTFGNNGRVAATFGASTSVFNLAVLSNGQIVVDGDHLSGPTEFLDIARFNSDGTPDTTYGTGGIAEFDVSGDVNSIGNVAPVDMAVRADGTVIVAGSSLSAITLMQLDPTGALDPSFGAGGIVTTPLDEGAQASGIALEGDGKIVVVGYDGSELALLRYNTDGSLDTGFGNGGIVSEGLPGANFAGARVAIDGNNDQIVVGANSDTLLITTGGNYSIYGQYYFGLFRFNDDGSLDATFGNGGQVNIPTETFFGDGRPIQIANNLAVQNDGKILVGVNSFGTSLVDRYDANGSIDLTYGNGGSAEVSASYDFDPTGPFLALQGDGNLVVASNTPSDWKALPGIVIPQDTVVTRLQADNDMRPTPFGSAEAFRQYLIDQAVQQYGPLFGTPYYPIFYAEPMLAAGVSAGNTSYSTTNTQVAGVDEGDIVKTDGQYLYVLSNGNLVILNAWPASSLRTLSVTALPGDPLAEYLDGNRLTVITQTYSIAFEPFFGPPTLFPSYRLSTSGVNVMVYDVSNPAAPAIVQETTLDGSYNSSRAIGNTVYVALNNNLESLPGPWVVPAQPPFPFIWPGYAYVSEAQYVAYLETIPLESLLPPYTTFYTDANGPEAISGLISQPANIYQPDVPGDNNLVSLVSFDVAGNSNPGPTNSVSLLTSYNATLYAATDNFYLITSRWSYVGDWTFIDQLSLANGGITLTATGAVPGDILNQLAVSENGSYLYIATTSNWGFDTTDNLYVLTADGAALDVVGQLDNIAPGESINAVTFIGDRAYIATGAQLDPLFAVDLSNPTDPVLGGSLEISGTIEYLQAIDATHLIGISQSDSTTGYGYMIDVSLFDVSNLNHPTLLSTYDVAPSGWSSFSAALYDPHAITYDPATQTLALPINSQAEVAGPYGWSEWVSLNDLVVFHVDPARGTMSLQGEISDVSNIERGVIIGNTVYAISDTSVQAAALNALSTPIAQAPLPPPIFPYWYGNIWLPVLPIVVVPIYLPQPIVIAPIFLNPVPAPAPSPLPDSIGPLAGPSADTSAQSPAAVATPVQMPTPTELAPLAIDPASAAPTNSLATSESLPISTSASVTGVTPAVNSQDASPNVVSPAPSAPLEPVDEAGFVLGPDARDFCQPVALFPALDVAEIEEFPDAIV